MERGLFILLILIAMVGCRKDDFESADVNTNTSQSTTEEYDYYPYYEYDYTSEFIGDFAYFAGTITDTSSTQSLEGFKIRNTQGMNGASVISNGEYMLSSARGEVVGYYECYYPELDTVIMEIVDENNNLIKTLYLLGDTLIYNDTIHYDIQF